MQLPRLGYKGDLASTSGTVAFGILSCHVGKLTTLRPPCCEETQTSPYGESLRLYEEGRMSVQLLAALSPPLFHYQPWADCNHGRHPIPDPLAEPFQNFSPRGTIKNNEIVVTTLKPPYFGVVFVYFVSFQGVLFFCSYP